MSSILFNLISRCIMWITMHCILNLIFTIPPSTIVCSRENHVWRRKASVHYTLLWSITEPIPDLPRLHRDCTVETIYFDTPNFRSIFFMFGNQILRNIFFCIQQKNKLISFRKWRGVNYDNNFHFIWSVTLRTMKTNQTTILGRS